ncbi:hypothetical protein [Oryza sativa Japonica Group]|uniref:Uncharacterized protein n=2 Tax=Oryza sativa subsp. japonica TaxID=39947 RepID=Q5ZCF9_ORYSJ|nr:hypothetical protein [Oryza sativa Japonica Group]BAD53273.1 hypothetical protein [Oryza sativa Japonica Group]
MRRRSWLPRAARAPRDHSRGRGRGLALLRTRRLSVIRRATPTSLLPFRCGLVGVRALSTAARGWWPREPAQRAAAGVCPCQLVACPRAVGVKRRRLPRPVSCTSDEATPASYWPVCLNPGAYGRAVRWFTSSETCHVLYDVAHRLRDARAETSTPVLVGWFRV